jgi:hypothetical protein
MAFDEDLWPPIDEALIKRLEETIPERCPHITDEDRAIWMYAGQREVVRMLRAVYLEQQQED